MDSSFLRRVGYCSRVEYGRIRGRVGLGRMVWYGVGWGGVRWGMVLHMIRAQGKGRVGIRVGFGWGRVGWGSTCDQSIG